MDFTHVIMEEVSQNSYNLSCCFGLYESDHGCIVSPKEGKKRLVTNTVTLD